MSSNIVVPRDYSELRLRENMVEKPKKIATIIQISSLGLLVMGVLGLLFFNIVSDRIRFFQDIRYFKMIKASASIIGVGAVFSLCLGSNYLVYRWIEKKKVEFEEAKGVGTFEINIPENQ